MFNSKLPQEKKTRLGRGAEGIEMVAEMGLSLFLSLVCYCALNLGPCDC
jgi:hypothetical protein